MTREDQVLEIAREVGFDLAGIARLEPPPDAERFEAWLDDGLHGGLEYLDRNRRRIVDPRLVRPDARSLLVVGLAHSRPEVALPAGGRVARYAAGRDYHNVVGRMLRKLARALEREGLATARRSIVDAGPLLERSHAAAAGLGFASKAANLLHPRFGPWFFLGELFLSDELEPTHAPPEGSCGTCTACLDACPTDAIVEPGRVDAGLCISFHTIENRGRVPFDVRERTGDWAFGCDVCSEVCPWGHDAPDLAERFGLHPAVGELDLVDWLDPDLAERGALAGSPLQRPRREGLARNAAIALASLPSGPGRSALLRALSRDPSALVREAAAWALAQGRDADASTRAAVERAAGRETDGAARADMLRALEGGPDPRGGPGTRSDS